MPRSTISARLDGERARHRFRVRRIIIAICVFAAASLSTFSGSAVCSHCGLHRHFIQFQIPFTNFTYWTHETVEDTPLSDIASDFLPPAQTHNWILIHGHSFTTTCGIGPGRFVEPNTTSDQVVGFLAATQKYRGVEAARHYLAYALDPEKGRQLRSWLDLLSFPAATSIDSQSFNEWMDRAGCLLSEWELLVAYQPESAS